VQDHEAHRAGEAGDPVGDAVAPRRVLRLGALACGQLGDVVAQRGGHLVGRSHRIGNGPDGEWFQEKEI
jgi:hypothetical protein